MKLIKEILQNWRQKKREALMQEIEDLINELIIKLEILKTYELDEIDKEEIREAYDTIDLLLNELEIRK